MNKKYNELSISQQGNRQFNNKTWRKNQKLKNSKLVNVWMSDTEHKSIADFVLKNKTTIADVVRNGSALFIGQKYVEPATKDKPYSIQLSKQDYENLKAASEKTQIAIEDIVVLGSNEFLENLEADVNKNKKG